MRKLRRFRQFDSLKRGNSYRVLGATSTPLSHPASAVGAYCAAQRLIASAERRAALLVEAEVTAARNRAYESASREAIGVIASVSRFREHLLENDRNEALKIIIEILQEVLGEALVAQPMTLNSRINRAFEKVKYSGACSIRVNPRDSEHVAAYIRSRDSEWAAPANIALIEDGAVRIGCARIESKSATIELDPWAHLKAICDRLGEAFQNSEAREREKLLC